MDIPLFPLHTVLCPGIVVPLHVFEERYRALTQHCLDTGQPFGVVLIKNGREVGDRGVLVAVTHGGTARATIGHLLGLTPDQWRVLGGLANACWSVLSAAGPPDATRWRLTEHNAGTLPEPVVGDDR